MPRREAVAGALNRLVDGKPGLVISPACKVLRKGFAGGYHFKRVRVTGDERYHDVPDKNAYSHVHDALQYALSGGGEARALTGLRSDPKAMRPVVAQTDFNAGRSAVSAVPPPPWQGRPSSPIARPKAVEIVRTQVRQLHPQPRRLGLAARRDAGGAGATRTIDCGSVSAPCKWDTQGLATVGGLRGVARLASESFQRQVSRSAVTLMEAQGIGHEAVIVGRDVHFTWQVGQQAVWLVRILEVGDWGGGEPLYQQVLWPHPVDVDRKVLGHPRARSVGSRNSGSRAPWPSPGRSPASFGVGMSPCPDEGC